MESGTTLRVLCVGRHEFLSEHFARFFKDLGLETSWAVGLDGAVLLAKTNEPHVVVCDYDLLATLSLEVWESDELLSRTPVIAVSLTRRPNEVHLLDVNGIGGFLYLPTLKPEFAYRILNAAAARSTTRLGAPSLSVSSLGGNAHPAPVS